MSSYLPPSARMRQIKRSAPPPSRSPTPLAQNVEDALVQMATEPVPEAVFVVEIPEPPVVVPEPEPLVTKLKFDSQAKKAELISIGLAAGLAVDDTMTKNEIIAALQAAK